MKKLMIAAAAAAMIGSAFAEAQVIVWNLNLKTTTCKKGKVAAKTWWINGPEQKNKGDEVVYRTQSTAKLTGLTWGCYCGDALNGVWNQRDIVINKDNDTIPVYDGITFWSAKEDAFLGGIYNGTEFDWSNGMLNRMGKNADEVEMCFELIPSADAIDTNFAFTLAGFGKVKDVYNAKNDNYCDSYLASASGSITGFMNPDSGAFTCTYCDQYGVDCDVYDYCECNPNWVSDSGKTVAFGTWTAKYNSAASKKLRTQLVITKSYTGFSKEVKAELVRAGE